MMQKPFLRRQRLFERKIFEKIHFFDLQTAQGKMKERERERLENESEWERIKNTKSKILKAVSKFISAHISLKD